MASRLKGANKDCGPRVLINEPPHYLAADAVETMRGADDWGYRRLDHIEALSGFRAVAALTR